MLNAIISLGRLGLFGKTQDRSFTEKGALEWLNTVIRLRAFVFHQDMKVGVFLLRYGDKLPHTRFLLAKSKSASKILILLLIIVQNGGLQVEA